MLLARDAALPQTRRAGTQTCKCPHPALSSSPCRVPPPTLGLCLGPYLPHYQGSKDVFSSFLLESPCPPSQFQKEGSPPSPTHLPPNAFSPSCLLPTPQERADVDLKEVKSTSAAFLWSPVIHRAGWGESTGKEGGGKATRDILYNSKAQRSVQTGNRQPP